MDGRVPPPSAARPRLRPWTAVVLAAVIILATLAAFWAVSRSNRPEEWVLTSLAKEGYVAYLSPDVPIAVFGSAAFQGPFVVEVTAIEGPVEMRLDVNGEPVLRGKVHDLAYVYPFETDAGKPLSADLFLSLPTASASVQVFIGFSVPSGTLPATFRSASLSPTAARDGLFFGPVRSAVTAAEHSDPAVTLETESHSFPPDSTACWGFTSFRPRGYGWANVTVPGGVRYYYEIWSKGAQPDHLIMGDVEGSTMNHLHWTPGAFDLQPVVCKPSTSASFEVAVEGPM